MLLDGEDIYDRSVDVVDLRRRVGMVFQKSNPFPKSIFENVAYGLRINGVVRRRTMRGERGADASARRRCGTRSRTGSTIRRWGSPAASSSASASPARSPSIPKCC